MMRWGFVLSICSLLVAVSGLPTDGSAVQDRSSSPWVLSDDSGALPALLSGRVLNRGTDLFRCATGFGGWLGIDLTAAGLFPQLLHHGPARPGPAKTLQSQQDRLQI